MRNFVECCLGGDPILPDMTLSARRTVAAGRRAVRLHGWHVGRARDEEIASRASAAPTPCATRWLRSASAPSREAVRGSDNTSAAALQARCNDRAAERARAGSTARTCASCAALPGMPKARCSSSSATRRCCARPASRTRVPPFLRGKGQGWVTAEYGMLPRSTHTRTRAEAARGKQSGRTQEIQRLIGRSLRAVIDLKALGERTITIDCDVLQADGGTRTAAITGGYVALAEACEKLVQTRRHRARIPFTARSRRSRWASVAGVPVLDLDYAEDSQAETDMNVVMNNGGGFVEIQGTAEGHAFRRHELDALLDLAANGLRQLFALQIAGARAVDDREAGARPAATRASCASWPRCSRPLGHEFDAAERRSASSRRPRPAPPSRRMRLLKARHAALHAGLPRWPMIRASRSMRWAAGPGVYSARYAGEQARRISENLEKMLAELQGVAPGRAHGALSMRHRACPHAQMMREPVDRGRQLGRPHS